MNLDIPFKLFACCFPVSGKERALICDVQRNLFEFIPLALFEILEVLEGKTLNEVKLFFNHLHDDLIEEYFYFFGKQGIYFLHRNARVLSEDGFKVGGTLHS